MTATVAGTYKNGKIELDEMPVGIPEGRVWVTLVEDRRNREAPRYLVRGKYKTGHLSTEEDFKIAEWHG